MNCGKKFLNTLKRIRYPKAVGYDSSSFDSFFDHKEVSSFLEIFCRLTEDNVLTPEEIIEYNSLTPDELAKIEILGELPETDFIKPETRKEFEFLQEHLYFIQNHNEVLLKQLETLKKHEENLLKNKNDIENVLLEAKKKFQYFTLFKISHVKDEFTLALKSISETIEELETVVTQSQSSNTSSFCSLFKESVEHYLQDEKKILERIKIHLDCNFQHEDISDLSLPFSISQTDQLKELVFLQKVLKNATMDNMKATSEIAKLESIMEFFRQFEDENYFQDLNLPPSQLKCNLDEVTKHNEDQKKKEEELRLILFDAINKHVDAQFNEVALSCLKEKLSHLRHYHDKIILPADTLIDQRIRLKYLMTFLRLHKEDLHSIKQLIEQATNQIQNEHLSLSKRKCLYEQKSEVELPLETDCLFENSVFASLYKILTTVDDLKTNNKVHISAYDILGKANKLLEEKKLLKTQYDSMLQVVTQKERDISTMEKFFTSTSEEYSMWSQLERNINVELNNLDLKQAAFEASLSESQQYFDQRKELLERKSNLRLARDLFVYALTNRELFEKYIEDIKAAAKYN